MIPEDLVFISAQPHDPYFQWQVEVQITNFRKFGVSKNMHILVWYPKHSKELPKWELIQKKYPEVKIFVYPDKGVNLGLYISQLRPHILKEHFKIYDNEFKGKTFFYHDSDIIFNYLPDFSELIKGDISWQSNTTGYLDYSYMRRKEVEGNIPFEEAVQKFAEIGDISVDTIKNYDGRTGGAQYILRSPDSEFWEDVERMCLEIRGSFMHGSTWVPNVGKKEKSINTKYFPNEAAGFQSWCADMWAINFAMWKRGISTQVTDKLDFSWATDSMDTYNKKPIYHNAGATADRKDIFYKGAYIHKSPLYQDIPLPEDNKASRQYVLAIKDVK